MSVAVPIQTGPKERSLDPNRGQRALSEVEYIAVRLYASGKTRGHIAILLSDHVYPKKPKKDAVKAMKKRLRSWEETQWFRDAVYDATMTKTDMALPQIMAGVRSRAKRGRVDAARLALEVTGRHNPRGESSAPSVVQINFGGNIPRPQNRVNDTPPEEIEAPILEIEDAVIEDEPSNGSSGPTDDLSVYHRMLARLKR
jgi:hypothetical protein